MAFELGSVIAKVDADITGFKSKMNEAQGSVDRLKGAASAGVTGLKQIGAVAAVGAAAVFAFGTKAAFSSARIDELTLALHSIAKANKLSTKEADNAVAALRENNIAHERALKITSMFIQSELDVADAIKVSTAAKDLAVIAGMDSSEATETLTTAIATQEPMLLRQFGIIKNLPEIYEDFGDATTEVEKKQAFLNAILEGGAKVAGTYDAAQESVSKRFRSLTGRIIPDFIAKVGKAFDPALTVIIDAITNSLQSMEAWIDANKAQIEEWGQKLAMAVNAGISALGMITKFLIEHKEILIGALVALGIGLGVLVVAFLAAHAVAIVIFAAITAIIAFAVYAWNNNLGGFRDFVQMVVAEIVNFFQNYLMPFIMVLVKFWQDNWGIISATLKAAWLIISGIVQVAWALVYGIIKVGLALLSGDWKAAWEAIKQMVSTAWGGIKRIFEGALSFIKNWGGMILHHLVKPFEDAWNKIKELVEKIKNAMDPNKRQSPSMVDRLRAGVADLNDAWAGLVMAPNLSATAAGLAVNRGGNSSNNIMVRVDMAGAMIADAYGANQMAEVMGDAIVERLQSHVRV